MTDERIRIRVIEIEGRKDDLTDVLELLQGREALALATAEPEAPEDAGNGEPSAKRQPLPSGSRYCDECNAYVTTKKHREHKARLEASKTDGQTDNAPPAPFDAQG